MSKKVSNLKAAPYNPRKISDQQLENLQKAMELFGDLGCIVLNVRTGHLIGGHQRVKNFDPAWPIEKRDHKDQTGTVAVGVIKTPWGDWNYREVDWDEKKEIAANIAANKHGGEFDIPKLKDILTSDYFNDGQFDFGLMGFEEADLGGLFKEPPAFKEVSEDLQTENECPSCHYKW